MNTLSFQFAPSQELKILGFIINPVSMKVKNLNLIILRKDQPFDFLPGFLNLNQKLWIVISGA